jgi:hypothetical protein
MMYARHALGTENVSIRGRTHPIGMDGGHEAPFRGHEPF